MNHRPRPGIPTGYTPAGWITPDDMAQDAGFMLPRVTVPRHMLEDTPPSPSEQIRDAIHAHQAAELAAYNHAHPGRHAHPYDADADREALRWNLDPEPRHRA